MKVLLGKEANDLLGKYLPGSLPKYQIAKNLASLKNVNFKFPFVVKLISQQAIHKTELGAVKIVNNSQELGASISELQNVVKKHRLRVEILVQEFVKGQELIVGIKKDATFGHVIMFGLGGVYVELLRDVTFRVCPIQETDVREMIKDLKAKQVLEGYRGESLNLKQLTSTLVKISQIPQTKKDLFEMDINPLIVNKEGTKIVDTRIVFN